MTDMPHRLLADAVLILHMAIVMFVAGSLPLIAIGVARNWQWVKNLWFRLLHVGTIAFVVVESWLGIVCPLTTLELRLRKLSGQTVYDGDFISHWLRSLLFFEAPAWVFTVCYSCFGALVILSWLLVPPRSPFSQKFRKKYPAESGSEPDLAT